MPGLPYSHHGRAARDVLRFLRCAHVWQVREPHIDPAPRHASAA